MNRLTVMDKIIVYTSNGSFEISNINFNDIKVARNRLNALEPTLQYFDFNKPTEDHLMMNIVIINNPKEIIRKVLYEKVFSGIDEVIRIGTNQAAWDLIKIKLQKYGFDERFIHGNNNEIQYFRKLQKELITAEEGSSYDSKLANMRNFYEDYLQFNTVYTLDNQIDSHNTFIVYMLMRLLLGYIGLF